MDDRARSAPVCGRTRRLAVLVAALLLGGLLAPGVPQLSAGSASAATCPCTIWASTATPVKASDPDTAAVELGVKLRSDVAGFITGIRFYKGTGNTGTHTGSLWSTDGTRLATATFEAETATGWQQVRLASPVAVAAGTTYIASYYAPNGRYAADTRAFSGAGVDNGPLHALADGVDGANGVYRYGTGGGFPQNTFQSANYWVDVVFETSTTDTAPPTITTRAPAADSTGALVGSRVSATFDEPVTGAQMALAGASAVTGTTGYDAATRTLTFTPSSALAPSTRYTATVSAAADAAGNTMATTSWSFTTASTTTGCPCSLWPASATPASASNADTSAVELGVRFRSDVSGFVTGVRFFKGAANTGTHVGSLWTAAGVRLGSAVFGTESATGWQSVSFASPVAIAAATDYIASYYAPNGGYATDDNGLSAARVSPPLRTLANSTATPNGVYRYGQSAFPSSSFKATNYWVDVVFDTTASDRTAPSATSLAPASGATSVPVGTAVTAAFDEAVDPTTLVLSLRTSGGAAVAGSTSYDADTRTATLVPAAPLAASSSYTASVQATDSAGNRMTAPTTWSFTTAAPVVQDPALSGPVLVVAPEGTGFGRYLPEILKNEGLNAYESAGPSVLTPTGLAKYDVVLLGETALTASQVTVLTDWVTAGGNLVAMRPDKKLAGLLGLTSTTGTLADAYLQVDTATPPGRGVTGVAMQFHSTADRYTLPATGAATSVATLLTSATATTANPAVTLRSVGTAGGQAAAFTYDLARSVVYTRQGNPAWAGTERDGQAPIRSDDMYFGATRATDYVDLTRASVPQADEQQRLLANLVQTMVRDRKPLPRFWYFPRMEKAVVVATGDDHGNNGTLGRYQQYEANSAAGCSVLAWQCLRFSSYVYPATPLSAADARSFDAKGFETGVHPSSGCGNFTPTSLDGNYASQLGQWQSRFTGVPSPVSNRFHCLVFSDWASQPKTELKYGMGLDTNYYYWPGSWVADRPGFMTGSGMAMRFADLDGTVLGSYQAATQMTDESGQSYPNTPNVLLDNALGAPGYYGAFMANVHTDQATTFQSDQLIASARARGVPVIAARQLLTWLRGRDASRFTDLTWNADSLSFGIRPGAGADGLTALLPTGGPNGGLTAVTSDGTAVAFTTQTLKGVEYAVFPAAAGSYVATYGAPAAPTGAALRVAPSTDTAAATSAASSVAASSTTPAISDVEVTTLPDGTAEVAWRTDVAADSEVVFGKASGGLDERRRDDEQVTEHAVVLTDLVPGTSYRFVVRSTGRGGGTVAGVEGRFVQSAAGVADTTAASLRVGSRDPGAHVASRKGGEVQLAADDESDFDVPELPPGWATEPEDGGRTVVYAGRMTVDGTRVLAPPRSGPRALEVDATFTGDGQLVALATGVGGPGAAVRSRDGRLFASVGAGNAAQTPLDPALLRSPHRYRIDWDGTTAVVSVDGKPVAQGALRAQLPLRPVVRDTAKDGAGLTLSWLQGSAFRPASTFVSRVLDAQQLVTWDRATWRADLPPGTSVRVGVRTGVRRTPDATWSGWTTLSGPGARVVGEGRYLQYRLELTTTDPSRTPVVRSFGVTHNGDLPAHEREVR